MNFMMIQVVFLTDENEIWLILAIQVLQKTEKNVFIGPHNIQKYTY